MSISIRIPTQLRQLTGGEGEVLVEATTVGEALRALEAANPGFGERIFDDAGALRRFVNVFLADEDVRFLEGLETRVVAGQVISIVPAVAGG
jgi:sulfur-carrier protein